MQSLRSQIPPPNWLVTFEAAARCLSFTKAASELNVTRVAVSQQIKSLETYLGTPLFHRLHRAIKLTPAGEQYQRGVALGLQTILTATGEVQKSVGGNSVTVTTSTGFSTFWLLPRIGDFRRLHPDIDVQFLVADNYLNMSVSNVDVAVRYGNGDWPNVNSQFLLQEEIYPVCSPSYLRGRKRPQFAVDLLYERLLHLEGRYDPETRWRTWFAEQGVDAGIPPHGLRLNTYTNLVQAALDGQGIALIGPPLMQKYLTDGALIRLVDAPPLKRRAFYLALPKDRDPTPVTDAFCKWIEQAVNETSAGARC